MPFFYEMYAKILESLSIIFINGILLFSLILHGAMRGHTTQLTPPSKKRTMVPYESTDFLLIFGFFTQSPTIHANLNLLGGTP